MSEGIGSGPVEGGGSKAEGEVGRGGKMRKRKEKNGMKEEREGRLCQCKWFYRGDVCIWYTCRFL